MYLQSDSASDRPPSRIDFRTFVTGVVVPIVVALVATQVDLARAVLLVGIAAVAMVFGLGRDLRQKARNVAAKRADARLAHREMPRFRALVRNFEQFVLSNRSKALHNVLSHMRGPAKHYAAGLMVVDQYVFLCWWRMLAGRVEVARPSSSELLRGLADLSDLISSYRQSCLDPVFNNLDSDFQKALTQDDVAELEGVRENFVLYLGRVEEFAASVRDEVRNVSMPEQYFERPKALVARRIETPPH